MVKPITNMETAEKNILQERKQSSKQQPFTPRVTESQLKSRDYTALVLGNGTSRRGLDIAQLRHVGTTYSCNAAYRDFFTDYLVVMDDYMLGEIIQSKTYEDTIVYTQHTNANEEWSTRIPLYFTSSEPATLDSGSAAVKLAARHGHTIIWMVGFDGMCSGLASNVYANTRNYPPHEFYNLNEALVQGWQRNLHKILCDFPNVQFYHVTDMGLRNALPNYHTVSQEVFKQVIKGKQP